MTRIAGFLRGSLAGLVAAFLVMLIGNVQVGATSGQAFSLSPPVVELKVDKGQKTTVGIKLTNLSSSTLSITAAVNDFGAKNETGEPNILFDNSSTDNVYSLRQWVQVPGDFTIASKETKTITVPIQVPTNAEPGGHYGVVRFTGTNAGGDVEQVALSASIGSLLLLQVNGTISIGANVEDFYTANGSFAKSGFFEAAPLQLVTRIKNTGNVHIKPTGTVEIKDTFGNKVSTVRMNGNPSAEKDRPGSILPQSVRRFNTELKDLQLFGRYTATMKLNYGEGKTLEKTTEFWVIPYRLILMIVLLLAVVVAGSVFGIKRYNAYIIQKAEKANRHK